MKGVVNCLVPLAAAEISANAKILQTGITEVLTACADAYITSAECADGLAELKGVVNFRVLCVSSENLLVNFDYNAAFSGSVESDIIKENGLIEASVEVKNVNATLSSNEIAMEAVLMLTSCYYKEMELPDSEYSSDIMLKQKAFKVNRARKISHPFVIEEEITLSKTPESIIMLSAKACVEKQTVNFDSVGVYGKAYLEVCYTSDGELHSEIIPVDFTTEIDRVYPDSELSCCLKAVLTKPQIRMEITEEGEKNLVFRSDAVVGGVCKTEEEAQIATQAFSLTNMLNVDYAELCGGEEVGCGEQGISAEAMVEAQSPKALINKRIKITQAAAYDGIIHVEGEAQADLLTVTAEKSTEEKAEAVEVYRSYPVSAPFTADIPLDRVVQTDKLCTCGMNCEGTNGKACGLNVCACGSVKNAAFIEKNSETKIEFDVKLLLNAYKQKSVKAIRSIEVGDELPESFCTVEVYFGRKGDTLWDVAKELIVSPNLITACNPDTSFPLNDDAKIIVYRELKR
ncbi:MAG: DUF3794 domain-containing protein [Clostridia bacterium]|nr:DUF3794 domain-containing protein [Clostridia bacterium]